MADIIVTEKTAARFWAKAGAMLPGTCWLWTGAKTTRLYGNFRMGQKQVMAHRIAWVLANGRQIPDGGLVRHSCDTPLCVNPAHLLLGTQQENVADRVARGRNACGEKSGARTHPETRPRGDAHWSRLHPEWRSVGVHNGNAKLTEDIVRQIRSLSSDGMPKRAIARAFGIDQPRVQRIVSRKLWAHVL